MLSVLIVGSISSAMVIDVEMAGELPGTRPLLIARCGGLNACLNPEKLKN